MEQLFSSCQNLRYLPGTGLLISELNVEIMIEKAVSELQITLDQECMICYSLYTPVISMSINE